MSSGRLMHPGAEAFGDVEMLRDGGSFSATFSDAWGHNYSLFIRIKFLAHPTGGNQVFGYAEPVLRIPRVAMPIPTSWEQARVILDQVLRAAGENQNQEWVATMSKIIATNGKMPERVECFQESPGVECLQHENAAFSFTRLRSA